MLQAELECLLTGPNAAGLATQMVETIDNDHGRLELRHHIVCHEIDWLFSDSRDPGEIKFSGLAMIGMIASETIRA